MVPLIKLGLLLVLALGSLAGFTGCATPPSDAVSDAQVPDRELERTLITRLNQEMLLDRASIGPASDEGVVTLKGVIHNEQQRMRAIAITRATPGVKGVIDELKRF